MLYQVVEQIKMLNQVLSSRTIQRCFQKISINEFQRIERLWLIINLDYLHDSMEYFSV